MTGKDLLITLGSIRHEYYEEAEHDFICAPSPWRRSLRKPLMVAAITALMLFLMGCAWAIMHMQDLRIGEHALISHNEEMRTLDILSQQGIKDTPNYLANQEWLQFTQTYAPELDDYWQSDENYWAYNVQNQVMVDKLDEICAKYGLSVIGKPWHEHVDCYKFLELADVHSLLKSDSTVTIHIPRGRFFAGGSFSVYGTLTLPNGELLQNLDYNYIKKDVFYDVFTYIDSDAVTERGYKTEDGVSLLLLEGDRAGMIMADRGDCFITIGIDLSEQVSLEEIAEQFDFSVQANQIDAAAADAREQASLDELHAKSPDKDRFVRNTYGEYVADLLWNDSLLANDPSVDILPREYTFYDLDGNGEKELLIYCNGYIEHVVAMKDGKTDEGKSYRMQLCEDNVLIHQQDLGDGSIMYHIFRFANDGDPVFSNPKEQSIVRLKEENGTWWRTSSTDHYADYDTQITEDEAMEILDSYPHVALDTRPITEFEEQQ